MTKEIEISDEKIAVAFRSIMQRVSNEVIDEMIETGVELDSNNFIWALAKKFERYEQLLAVSD